MSRVFVATCESCGFAEERRHLTLAAAEADMHEGTTGHRTRVVEYLSEDMPNRAATRPAGPAEMPTLQMPKARIA